MSGAYRGIIARALWIPARTRCDIRPALSSLWRVNCVWCRSRPARQRSCWSASPSRTCLTSDVLLTGPGRRPNFDVFDVLKLTERPQLHPKFDVLSPPGTAYGLFQVGMVRERSFSLYGHREPGLCRSERSHGLSWTAIDRTRCPWPPEYKYRPVARLAGSGTTPRAARACSACATQAAEASPIAHRSRADAPG